jgi:hypothetical protein
MPAARTNGRIHMGLGCTMNTSNPEKDARTLVNGTSQFWSILTLLAINKLHQHIEDNNLHDRILVTSTIYDAIYLECDSDPSLVKWVNDTLVPIMLHPYLTSEVIHNEAELEVGLDWASTKLIPNNATLEQITTLMDSLNEHPESYP